MKRIVWLFIDKKFIWTLWWDLGVPNKAKTLKAINYFLRWWWSPYCPNDPNMITIMSKHCVEDCYEELNARLRTLIGYYDDINMWRTTPIKCRWPFNTLSILGHLPWIFPCAKMGTKYHLLPYHWWIDTHIRLTTGNIEHIFIISGHDVFTIDHHDFIINVC